MAIDRKGWKKVLLGDVCRNLNITERLPLQTGIDRYIGLEHIEPGNLHLKSWGNIADGTTFTKRFKPGHVLFGKRRAYQKKAAVADFTGICSGDILVLEAIGEMIDPRLLPFVVQADRFFEFAVQTSAGSLSPRTKFQDLAKYSLLLPPKEEQARLAELLWAGDEVVERYEELLQKLNQGQTIYGLNNFEDNTQPLSSLSNIAEINPRMKREIRDPELKVSFLAMADVSEEGKVLNHQVKTLNEVKKGFTYFGDGDILFAKITPCMENGKGALAKGLVNEIGFGSTEFHVIRPLNKSDKLYCFYLSRMSSFRKEAEKAMVGSAGQKRVQSDFFDFFKIHLPQPEQRIIFGEIMNEFENELDKTKELIRVSKTIQKHLINQIF